MVSYGTIIHFWKDLWWGDLPLCLQFPRLSKVTTTKNLSISAILGNDTSLSWDLIFCWNLTDVKIEDLERLMSLLSHVHLTSFVPNVKTWVSSSLGVLSIKKFLLVLSNFSYFVPFYLINFLWKSRVPSKVMAFAWLVAYKKVNTNDIL